MDRDDFERCFERFIDFRNNMNNSLLAWLIERDDCELAAWWLSSRHNALEDNLWSDVEDMPREKERLRQDARKLAAHLRVTNPLIRHMADLEQLYVERIKADDPMTLVDAFLIVPADRQGRSAAGHRRARVAGGAAGHHPLLDEQEPTSDVFRFVQGTGRDEPRLRELRYDEVMQGC